jgi:hypothetical protein
MPDDAKLRKWGLNGTWKHGIGFRAFHTGPNHLLELMVR